MKSNYEKVKEWRAKNPDKVAAQARRYAKNHPDKLREKALNYRAANIEKVREQDKLATRRRRAKDPVAQKIRYERWRLKKEAELWDIAGRPRAERCELCLEDVMTVFDHCHKEGYFRGWICDRCNRVLGSVKDSTDLLNAMILYLENSRGKINSQKTKLAT